jgi:uncharacterized protein YndB with AHSA1/START domain/DNA-binding transcriptional ArsR family regulator
MATDPLSLTFAALADPTRRAILARLTEGPASVKELSAPFAMSGPAVSKHLRVLENAGLITRDATPSGAPVSWPRRRCGRSRSGRSTSASSGTPATHDWTSTCTGYRTRSPIMNTTSQAGKTSYTTPSAEEIVITRVVDAPRSLVFRVFTEPEHIRNWLVGPPGWTMPVCEVDLRVGGGYRYERRQADGAELTITAEYHEISPPERLVTTETWAGWPATENIVEFTESGGRTTITTTVRYTSEEHRDNALRSGMIEGMESGYVVLDGYLGTLAR